MATLINFHVSPDDFALALSVMNGPSFCLTAEQIVTHSGESMIPFAQVATSDFDAFEKSIAKDPSVDSLSRLTNQDTKRLYHVEWSEEITTVLQLLVGDGNAVTSLQLNNNQWEFLLMCPEHNSVSDIYSSCIEHEISVDIKSIYELDSYHHSKYTLTDLQRATLVTAKEMGYYEVPREATLSELAEVLEVSHQALSERIRRAHGRLIKNTVEPVDRNKKMHSVPLED